MNNFVISVCNAQTRREHIYQQFNAQNVSFAFFDAVQPENLADCMKTHLPTLADVKHLRDVEKACFMSHVLLWKHCVAHDLSHIIIFEDDIVLSDDAAQWLSQSDWLAARFDPQKAWLIHLETFLMPTHADPTPVPDYANRQFLRLKNTHHGAAAYVVSRAAAVYLLDWLGRLPEQAFDALDELIFSQYLHNRDLPVYQISPALCIQELQLNQESSVLRTTLGNERFVPKNHINPIPQHKRERHFWEKIQREWTRMKKKTWGAPFVIPFK